MAGLASQGLVVGGISASIVAFSTAAAVILVLMFGIAAAVASAQQGLLSALKASGSQVKRWGAYLMVAVGALFLATSATPSTFVPFFS